MIEPRSVEWCSAGKSHIGAVRTLNEDAYLERPQFGIWAVADGMGGHEGGDKASVSVIAGLARVEPTGTLSEFIDEAKARLLGVNETLGGALQDEESKSGSTVVALLTRGRQVGVIWAGDSRAYLYRHGELKQLTVDHSRVQELVGLGLITPQEADVHPHANIITRAVGVSADVEFDTCVIEAEPQDTYLLCSDGLYRSIDKGEMEKCLRMEQCDDACDRLIAKAIDGGGEDNISAVVIRLSPPDATRKSAAADPSSTVDSDLTVIDRTRLIDDRD